jgi:hypothetical protein
MASSLADKYEDQNKRIEINPDLQAYVEARETENRLVIEKGKLHIIGEGWQGAFRKSGKYFSPRDYSTNWFGLYELENKLFGFVRNADSRLICDGGDYPLRLELVALAERDDSGSYSFKSSLYNTYSAFFKRGKKKFELNIETKSCFFEHAIVEGVGKCEILSPPDSNNFSKMEGGNVQQEFEADLRKMPNYLKRLRGCKFRE